MIIEFSTKCLKNLEKIKQKDVRLFTKIRKQLAVFQENPDHPSLRLHKLTGSREDSWSISIDMSIRMLFYYRGVDQQKTAVFFSVGKHEDVYI